MCEISVREEDLEIACKKTGKPIEVDTKYGMFCEDMCGLEENPEVRAKVEERMKNLPNIFNISL